MAENDDLLAAIDRFLKKRGGWLDLET